MIFGVLIYAIASAAATYVAGLSSSILLMKDKVDPEHLRRLVFVPLARLLPYILVSMVLFWIPSLMFHDEPLLLVSNLLFLLIFAPSFLVGASVVSLSIMFDLVGRYGHEIRSSFISFSLLALASLLLISWGIVSVLEVMPPGFLTFLLTCTAIYIVGGLASAPSSGRTA